MREVKLGWGWMSMTGVFGALSAQQGFRGGHGVLDGDEGFWIMAGSDRCEFDKMTDGLGTTYYIKETEFKIHPSIAWNHPPHTAIKKLVEEHDIKPDEVEKVLVKGLGAERIADYNPAGPVDAMFSLPYTIATTILREKLLPDMYSEEKIKHPQVQSLLKRITIQPDPQADVAWFVEHKEIFDIELVLKGGKHFKTHVEYPKDKPEFGKKEIEQKFRDLGSLSLPSHRVEQVIETVERLDQLRDISELAGLLSS
jgi:2-methylcitrate dehydratase PrpD